MNLKNLIVKFANLKDLLMDAEDVPWPLRKWIHEHTLHKGELF